MATFKALSDPGAIHRAWHVVRPPHKEQGKVGRGCVRSATRVSRMPSLHPYPLACPSPSFLEVLLLDQSRARRGSASAGDWEGGRTESGVTLSTPPSGSPPLRLLHRAPLPKLAGSWLLYRLPSSVRPALQQLGGSVPVRLGAQGVCHQGASSGRNTVRILPYGSPNGCPVPRFPSALGVSASTVWLEPQLGVSLAVGSLCGHSPKMRLQRALPGCPGACLWEQFSGNPTAGLLRAGTASLVLPSLTVSTEYLCISPLLCPRNGAQRGDLCVDSSAQTPGAHGPVWDECTMPDIIFVNLFVCFFQRGPLVCKLRLQEPASDGEGAD